VVHPTITFNSDIKLRDYQEDIPRIAIEKEQGLIISPAGSGKTEIGHELIARLGQPTLWLTHTKDLLEQSRRRAINKLNLKEGEWGTVGIGEYSLGSHVTFATVQTLARYSNTDLMNFCLNFGCIIVDEAHRAAAGIKTMSMFERVLTFCPAKYRYGLTASDHRADGLMASVHLILGGVIAEIKREEIQEHLITPKIVFVPTVYKYSYDPDTYKYMPFTSMLSDMALNFIRNEKIVSTILKERGRSSLILGDSLIHLEALIEFLKIMDPSAKVEYIHGGTPTAERKRILEDMTLRKSDYLFATYALAKEGLDIPCLERLFLVSPKKDKTVVEQAIGRVSRPYKDKTDAIVYDFWDLNMDICNKQARNRVRTVYMQQGCEIIGGPKVRQNKSVEQYLKF
jgi:superfamily II DNA or RNA helicase